MDWLSRDPHDSLPCIDFMRLSVIIRSVFYLVNTTLQAQQAAVFTT
jgi:hypothetical protein